MRKNIKLLNRLIDLFGPRHGLRLFWNLKRNRLDKLKVPFIKTPFSLRKGSSDILAFFQVFVNNEYYLDYVSEPEVIIDGGANIGFFSLMMKNKFPEAKVISIEPDPENFALLQKNTQGYSDLHTENAGLWSKSTHLKVYDKYEKGKWGMVVEENEEEGNIQALSISALMEKYQLDKIDILKLDIETSEKQVFQSGFEEWLPKTRMVITELHDWMEPGCAQVFFAAVQKCFKNYKYIIRGENTIIYNLDWKESPK